MGFQLTCFYISIGKLNPTILFHFEDLADVIVIGLGAVGFLEPLLHLALEMLGLALLLHITRVEDPHGVTTGGSFLFHKRLEVCNLDTIHHERAGIFQLIQFKLCLNCVIRIGRLLRRRHIRAFACRCHLLPWCCINVACPLGPRAIIGGCLDFFRRIQEALGKVNGRLCSVQTWRLGRCRHAGRFQQRIQIDF